MQTTSSHGSSTSAEPKPKTALWITLMSIFAATTLVMTGLFVWQLLREPVVPIAPVSDEIAQCQEDVQKLEVENKQLKKELDAAEAKADKAGDGVSVDKLPVVAFERAGLIDQAVMDELQEKIVEPMADYAPSENHVLLTVNIVVPENEGEEYIYTAIYDDGSTQSAVHSKRGEPVDWWVPSCMGECAFTDEFKANYPELMEIYESGQ